MGKSLRSPVRMSSLTSQIEEILVERIISGYYPSKSQLPPEDELAKEFEVSRATVRSALSSLTALGRVVRIHGVGTFVSTLPDILNPLDQLIDFQGLFQRHGYQPMVDYVYCAFQEAGDELAEMLSIPCNSQMLVTEKVFSAGEAPAIYCVNSIPIGILNADILKNVLANPDILEPLFEVLEKKLHLRVAYMHSRVYAISAAQIKFHLPLPFKKTTPVLVLDEVAFSVEGNPVFHTYEYHLERRMNFELIRRRFTQ